MAIGGIYPNNLLSTIFDVSSWYLCNYFNWFIPTGSEKRSEQILWLAFKVCLL